MKDEESILAQTIVYHKKKYYDGEPEITDEDYDRLEDQLRLINPDHPVLFMIGTPMGGKIKHEPPMLSSAKAYSLDEVLKWSTKIDGRSLFAGYKIDGLSLSLIYHNGKLIQAATRGNGEFGDDVTAAIMIVDNIPKVIPETRNINIRGEIYMMISEFNAVNKELDEDDKYSSPRNLAVGTLRQKDIRQLNRRNLSFKAFDLLGDYTKLSIKDLVELLNDWGFDTADKFLVKNSTTEIDTVFKEIANKRKDLDFEIDGVIFKYNLAEDRLQAGSTEHHPKWQIAWKFKNEGSTTRINDIIWQVGRSGSLTPVAIVEPVFLKGALINRVTLHNADFVENLNIAISDEVHIERAGDVIPKIVTIRVKGEDNFDFPLNCPSCNTKLIRDGVNLLCPADICREKDIQSIIHWIKMVDIEFVGSKTVEKLYDLSVVRHFDDLYSPNLDINFLEKNFGKNGRKMKKSIDENRVIPFPNFLAGLGIPTLGKKLGKELAKKFESLESLQNTNKDDLGNIGGISDKTANNILQGINQRHRIDGLLKNGIEIVYDYLNRDKNLSQGKLNNSHLNDYWTNSSESVPNNPSLDDFWDDESLPQRLPKEQTTDLKNKVAQGLKIYITGSVDGYSKKQLQKRIENLGFEWSTSVSGKLDILVYGLNAGGAKLEKARDKKVKIMPWGEFEEQYL